MGVSFVSAMILDVSFQRQTQLIAKLSKLDKEKRENTPFLVLRAPDDEAYLVMAAGTIGNMICSGALFIASKVLRVTLAVLLGGALIYIANDVFNQGNKYVFLGKLSSAFSPDGTLYFYMIIILVLVMLLALIAGSAFKIVYGWEMFLTSFTSLISQSTAIDNNGTARIVTLIDTKKLSLTHFIYNNPLCAEQIAAWMKALSLVTSDRPHVEDQTAKLGTIYSTHENESP